MARVPVEATAFAHRTRRIMVNVAALLRGPERRRRHEAWVTEFAAALRQGDAGAYVNFLGRRGRGAGPRGLPGGDLGPARGDQGALRPDQPLPAQPEHPAEGQAVGLSACMRRPPPPLVSPRVGPAWAQGSRPWAVWTGAIARDCRPRLLRGPGYLHLGREAFLFMGVLVGIVAGFVTGSWAILGPVAIAGGGCRARPAVHARTMDLVVPLRILQGPIPFWFIETAVGVALVLWVAFASRGCGLRPVGPEA